MIRWQIALALWIVGMVGGYLAHRPQTQTVTRDVVKYQDRIVVQEKRVEVKGATIREAGPVRTVVKRELVQGKCQETVTTERGPVVTHSETDRHEDTHVQTQIVTLEHTREHTVVAPLPRWSAAAYGGLGSDGTRAAVSLGYRLFGPVSVELMASSLVQPVKSPAVLAGLRVSF